MYPLKFTPVYQERIWGGTNLNKMVGRNIPGGHIGESWDLSSHPNGMSVVKNGFLAGKSLKELIMEYQDTLMGTKFTGQSSFPLLVKILDANDDLSIQVHPDDEFAFQTEGEPGKTEAWYVIHANEGAHILYGLKKDITREALLAAIQENRIGDAIRKVPVKPGDMVYVPAGTVHALMKGVMVYEIQQNSDTTYRLYDYDRKGKDGKPRELHLEKALAVIRFSQQPNCVFTGDSIHCQYFSMVKIAVNGMICEKTYNQFVIYCVIGGSGEISYGAGRESLTFGDTVLIPACMDTYCLKGELSLLKIT